MDAQTPPWYVLTAGPSAGKTTLLQEIASRGYITIEEAARAVIEEEVASGKTYAEVRADEGAFQDRVLLRKMHTEAALSRDQVAFFDRGIPDSDAYFKLIGVSGGEILERAMQSSQYRKAFLLELIPFTNDDVRKESADDAKRLNELLRESYEGLGVPVVDVPLMPVSERADFVLKECGLLG